MKNMRKIMTSELQDLLARWMGRLRVERLTDEQRETLTKNVAYLKELLKTLRKVYEDEN